MERNFKGIWIPANVWLDRTLSIMEKCFYVEIDSLDNENGCFASNQYFAEFFCLSKNRCSEIIRGLKEKGLIKIEYIYKEKKDDKKSREIEKRIIRCVRDPDKGIRKTEGGYSENRKDIYTNNNNTNNNIKDLNHIDIFSKNVCVDENIKGKFYADEDEMKSDFNKYINDFNLTAAGKDFIFELVEEFYRQLLYIKNIKHGLITEEVARKCIWIIIDNYAEYDLLDNYILYVREYFKSNRKYYSFQDFCNANTLRILSERCVKSGK